MPRQAPDSPPMSNLYRRVLCYFLPHWWPTALASLLSVVQTPLNLAKPWPVAFLIAQVLPAIGKPEHGLRIQVGSFLDYSLQDWTLSQIVAGCSISVVVLHLLSAWINVSTTMLYYRVGLEGLLSLRTDLYAYLHTLPLKFHDSRRSADSSFRVAYDSQSLQTFYSKGIFLFLSLKDAVSMLWTMWTLDVMVTVLVVAIVPLMVLTFRLFAKKIRDQATYIAERESAVLSLAQEGLSSVRMVQAFGREQDEISRFTSSAKQSLEANVHIDRKSVV